MAAPVRAGRPSREIESYWYPVWLCYPAGMLPDSKVVDAPPHKISIEQTVGHGQRFRAAGAVHLHARISRGREDGRDDEGRQPQAEGGLRRTAGHRRAGKIAARLARPSISWCAASSITRSPTTPRASRWKSCRASASARTATSSTTRKAPAIENLDELPWVTKVYQARSRYHALQRSVPAEPVHLVVHLARLPGACALSACGRRRIPATAGGCARPTTSRDEVRYAHRSISPTSRKSSSTTTPSTIRKDAHHRAVQEAEAAELHVVLHLARHHRLRHAEGHEGSRLPPADRGLRIGRPADPEEHQEGRHHRHGASASPPTARSWAWWCTAISSSGCPAKRARASARPSISPSGWTPKPSRFRSRTPIPGTEFYDYAKKNNLITIDAHDRRDAATSFPTSSTRASTAASWWSGWSASTANITSARG